MNFEAISKAVRARLANFTALTSISPTVTYEKSQDDTPESDLPYTVIEDVVSRQWDTKTSEGGEQLIQVTTYCRSRYTLAKGFVSATQLANQSAQAIYDALHNFNLSVSGSNVVICQFTESPGLITDPDGVTRYRPMTFRVVYDGGE
jgi:hypothetical protein